MPRFRLTIEYDGTGFVGWQRQANGLSIQESIEAAILAFCGETVTVRGAGRTDAGVHALGQVAHIDLARDWRADTVRDALNAMLRPAPISIVAAEPVGPAFDARFSARARHYLYRVVDRRAPPALDRDRVWHVRRPLDAAAMAEAAGLLLGHHDFTTFRSTECQAKSPIRSIDAFTVTRAGDEIRFAVSARSFLHNQVRSMVGSLKLVGEGRWRPADVAAALAARDRRACGPVAPPTGLHLVAVDYPASGFGR